MSTLNESRAWTRADSRNEYVGAAERDAYCQAVTADCGVVTYGDTVYSADRMADCGVKPGTLRVIASVDVSGFTDAMLAAEDATAERGSFPERVAGWFIAAVVAALTVGVLWTLGSIVWGWIS